MPEKPKLADLIARLGKAKPITGQNAGDWVWTTLPRNALPALIEIAKAAKKDIDACDVCDNEVIDADGLACVKHCRAYDALSAIDWEGVEDE